ncbi:conjugative transfer ATPase [Enterovibrio norvegicus]|uniref:conjugative transfer ATPase n=1 Tax=Enterovibrio norvegicus TaxID=188144 RepID=UPI000C854513|nr:conjugative transfer ATPase [Enterovibrio norvegicus]PMH64428.1 conjugative transfer ATPase [Enterovibrio norvegicus]
MINISQMVETLQDKLLPKSSYTQSELKKSYSNDLPSFASRLPYAGWDAESETFILEDLVSRAKVFTIYPIATEGKTCEQLAKIRDGILAVYDLFEERDCALGQWVMQEFSYEDNGVDSIIDRMRDYVVPHAKGSKFTESYLDLTKRHYETCFKEEGLYHDETVTGKPWRFRIPRAKLIIYRRQSPKDLSRINQGKHCPVDEIQQLEKEIAAKLKQVGLKFSVDDDISMFTWLFKFFNPNPEIHNFKNKGEYYARMCDIDSDLLVGDALCEALLADPPESSVEDNCWYLNGSPTRFLRFGALRSPPRIGAFTGEVSEGEEDAQSTTCLTDALPANAVITKTTVFAPQPEIDFRLGVTTASVKGHGNDAKILERNLKTIDGMVQDQRKKVFTTMGVYISGDNLTQLDDNQRKVITEFASRNIILYKDDLDALSLDSFMNHLPMNFRPEIDKGEYYLRMMWAQHSANLFLGYGRGEGTGNPCFNFFNRGGSPVFFDPMNKKDKNSNSFGFIAGPTGAGKSVTITQMCYQLMAMKLPRLFLVEYGDTYSMAAKDWEMKGLTVNYLKVMPECVPNLAPFSKLDLVLDLIEDEEQAIQNVEEIDYVSESDEENEDEAKQGDTLGELEMILLLMITGSEDSELARYTRADRSLFRKSLIETAKRQRAKGIENGLGKAEPSRVQDVQETLENMSKDAEHHESTQRMLSQAALSLEAFTVGINNKLFNQVGEGWPDADITIFNVGLLAQESNVAQLNVAMLSLLQHINNISEYYQFDERDIVSISDESHLFLNNNMLGKILTRVVKTARKLGHIPYFATQDIADLSGESEKILNNIEWFYCLNFGREEALRVKKMKNLSNEDVHLMISTRKQDRAYTEGVAISKKQKMLFRVSPPSLMLTIGMNESDEKAERRAIMREIGTDDELEAVYEMANRLDAVRGISGRLNYEELRA